MASTFLLSLPPPLNHSLRVGKRGKRLISFLFFFNLSYFWPHQVVCGILVPRPGIERRPTAVKAPCLNQCTAREFPKIDFLLLRIMLLFEEGRRG